MKKTIFFLLAVCIVFIAQADKIIIERPENQDIDSIIIENDTLTVRSRGKSYTFKFADLLKDKDPGRKSRQITRKLWRKHLK